MMHGTHVGESAVAYPSVEASADPWPIIERILAGAPIYEIPDRPNLFVVSRYEDVRYVLGHPELFSNYRVHTDLNGFDLMLGTVEQTKFTNAGLIMNEADSPYHKPKRDLAFPALKPARLKAYEPMIESVVTELINNFSQSGRCEFVSEFAEPLSSKVTLRLMGVPEADIEWVSSWARFEMSGLSWMSPEFRERQRAMGDRMQTYLAEKILERYEERTDDVISVVIDQQIQRDGQFDLVEVRAQCANLLGGGVGNVANFLSNLMLLLVKNPAVMSRVRSENELIPRLVDEALRLEPPSMWTPRRVLADTEIAGRTIPAGAFLIVLRAAANRDSDRFHCPGSFDIDRKNAREHMSFGYGAHFCLGAPLARMEIRIAVRSLLTRLANIRLVGERVDLEYIRSPAWRGLVRLELGFDREK